MRISGRGIAPKSEPISITVDGQEIEAYEGETVGAALMADGILSLRQPKHGMARGIYCGVGACAECLVTIDGVPDQRACMTQVAPGQTVQTCVPYADAAPAQPNPPIHRACDVLVIGAGPAGLNAARTARESGLSVVVIDEREKAGGQYFKQLAASHVFERRQALDRQYDEGDQLIVEILNHDVEIINGAVAWRASSPKEISVQVKDDQFVFAPRQLILATGAYERPMPFPGWTLPGVMTTGAAQSLLRAYRVAPGSRVVVAGNGPYNFQVAVELIKAGVRVAAVIEAAAKPGLNLLGAFIAAATNSPDLIKSGLGYLWRLRVSGTPVIYGHAVVAAEGEEQIEAVAVAPIGPDGQPDMAQVRHIAVDALCLNGGFVPSSELARQLGCQHRFDPAAGVSVPVRKDNGETSVPGVFVVGDGGGVEGARAALEQGALAGLAAAANLGKSISEFRIARHHGQLRAHRLFQRALWSLFKAPGGFDRPTDEDTLICRCQSVTLGALEREIANGASHLRALQDSTRAGTGRCEGRYCHPSLGRLLAAVAENQNSAADHDLHAPRA